jgi:hypothetical protein
MERRLPAAGNPNRKEINIPESILEGQQFNEAQP